MTELRHRRYYERRQFERAIADEVRAERERRRDLSLMVRKAAANDPLCRRLM